MKKLILSAAFFTALAFTANAQTEGAVQKLSIGAEVGLPTEEGTNGLMLAGGSVYYEHPIAKSFNLTGAISYLTLFSTEKNVTGSAGYTSLKAGGKYYFGGNFYAAGEVGATIQREGGIGLFAFAPGLGASFSIANKSSLDFGLRFETWSKNGSASFMGLRAAYAFGL